MNLPISSRSRVAGAQAAFTMIEIAIALGVIAIALVAIIGVLPTGMHVKRDNREETVIMQDGQYMVEAIRSGARGADELYNLVDGLWVDGNPCTFDSAEQIIGFLSTPGTSNAVLMRSLSGIAADRGPATKDFAFKYLLRVEVEPFVNSGPDDGDAARRAQRLHELRLIYRWPLLPDGTPIRTAGNASPKVFRALISGSLVLDTNAVPGQDLYFFRP